MVNCLVEEKVLREQDFFVYTTKQIQIIRKLVLFCINNKRCTFLAVQYNQFGVG